jgi:hypothetical protein
MKRAAILVASAVLASGAHIISASPAAADTPGCVTQQEFNQVHRERRMSRVHQVFDTKGRVASRDANRMHRYYKICGVPFTRRQAVHVIYREDQGVWKLRRKWADAQ